MCPVKIESGLGYKSSQVRVQVQVQQSQVQPSPSPAKNGLKSGLESSSSSYLFHGYQKGTSRRTGYHESQSGLE